MIARAQNIQPCINRYLAKHSTWHITRNFMRKQRGIREQRNYLYNDDHAGLDTYTYMYIYIRMLSALTHIYMYTYVCRWSNAFTLTPQEHVCISACFPDRVAHMIVGVHMCTSKSRHTQRQTYSSTENFTRRADNYQRIVDKHTEYVHTWHNKVFTRGIYP